MSLHFGWGLAVIVLSCVMGLSAEANEADFAEEEPLMCTKEELVVFFPPNVVRSVLVKAHIPEDQAAKIASELSHKNHELTKLVEAKAEKLHPNPFGDLNQRELASKIYRETRYEVFASVLKAHGITDEHQIHALLDKIQVMQSKLFVECVRRQHAHSTSSSSVVR